MDASIAGKLGEVLEQEISLYENVLELSEKKTKVLVEGKVAELDNITKVEQALILKIRKLDGVREKIISEIADELKMLPGDITLTKLMKHLGKEDAKRFKAMQEKITGIMEKLRNTNELNEKLIRNSLEYIDFSLNLLASAGGGKANYSKTGRIDDSKIRHLFDMKL